MLSCECSLFVSKSGQHLCVYFVPRRRNVERDPMGPQYPPSSKQASAIDRPTKRDIAPAFSVVPRYAFERSSPFEFRRWGFPRGAVAELRFFPADSASDRP